MAKMSVYWNYVYVHDSGNLKLLSGNPNARSVSFGYGCSGVVFKAILHQEPDPAAYLAGFTLEANRRSHDAGDTKLLFCPKPETEKSIGVLKIVRPSRFKTMSAEEILSRGIKVKIDPARQTQSLNQFEVLLESTDFILEDVQEQMAERFQLQETFGDFNVFFFGRRAEIFTYSGTLVNAGKDLAWRNNFLYNYENYLRGTKCAELKAHAYLLYDDVVREGFILSAAVSQNSTVEAAVKFTFTLLVTGKRILTSAPENVTESVYLDPGTDLKNITPDDFEFIRASGEDSELSWVGPPRTLGAEEIAHTPEFIMTEDAQLGGTEPPSDLQQVIVNRSIAALKTATSPDRPEGETDVLDYEILVDFVNSKQLAGLPETSQRIAGKRSSDVENQDGEVIVARLLSGTPVDELRLKEAVKAAGVLARDYEPILGSGVASNLRFLSEYFAPKSTYKVAPAGPNVNFKDIVNPEAGRPGYILAPEIESQLLPDILSKTQNIKSFNAGTTTEQVLDGVPVSILDALPMDKAINYEVMWLLQRYAAVFCLVPDPAYPGQLFEIIRTKFSGAQNQYGGKGNAVEFVRSQTIKNFKEVLTVLPDKVAFAWSYTINALRDSTYYQKVKSVMKPEDNLILGEGILYQSASSRWASPLAAPRALFVSQICVYLTGILAERSSTKRVGSRTTTDMVGGTLKGEPKDEEGRYFVDSYAQSLGHDKNARGRGVLTFKLEENLLFGKHGKVTDLADFPATPDGAEGEYVFIPHGRETMRFVVTRVRAHGESPKDRQSVIVAYDGLSAADRDLLLGGVVHLKKDDVQKINALRASNPQYMIYYADTMYREANQIQGSTEIVEAGGFNLTEGFTFGAGEHPTHALNLKQLMPNRSYGGVAVEYSYPTMGTIRGIVEQVNWLVKTNVVPYVKQVQDQLVKVISDPSTLTTNREIVLGVLAISNLSGSDLVVKIDQDLKYMGVTAGNYIDLAYMADIQKVAVESLAELQSGLKSAVARVQGSEVESAEVVKDADSQEREVTCG